MGIENIMYFALGALAASLLALAILPAVWRRAVRLTKKRIEAATPITMAEFRADKDQLRAEFALSTRRLEMNVEALRRRLSEQLRDINRKRSEVGAIKGERDTHLQQMRELEEREAELRRRILDLEKESADLTQRLRMRDREYADKVTQLETAREALRAKTPRSIDVDGKALSGDYLADVDLLQEKLEPDRKRGQFL
jgi:chromosome segregation ATPase